MLVIDRILYQATRPNGSAAQLGGGLDVVLAGALLIDLTLAGRVEVDAKGRVSAVPGNPTGDALLDHGYAVVVRRAGKRANSVLASLRKGLTAKARDHLTEAGLVKPEPGTSLGVFPVTRWPVTDAAGWERSRDELRATLLGDLEPTLHTASVLSVISAAYGLRQLLGRLPISGREQRRRVKEMEARALADASVSRAVRTAIEAANATIVAAMVAISAGAAGASSG